jgi:1-acyl-sn-glycerol-3-phosphate acyltransferase
MTEKRTSKRASALPQNGSSAADPAAEPTAQARPRRQRTPKAEASPAVETAGATAARPRARKRRPAPAPEPVTAPVTEMPAAAEAAPGSEDVSEEMLRNDLIGELDELIRRLRALSPGYNPPPFSPRGLLELIEQNVDKFPPDVVLGMLGKLRKTIGEDMFDVDTWKGIWYMLNYSVEYQADTFKRRLSGEYETDEWGFDREYLNAVRPFFEFMYKRYWRVQISGLENIPAEGRTLLVANHSGQLPWDGAMVGVGVLLEHPSQRIVRTLYATWFPTLPIISDIFVKCGQVLATEDNGIRLLEQDELVAVYPEGYKGVGKLYKDRYRLARFGRGGFVRMALKTGAPMLPVSIVGAEETYISLGKSDILAKLTGFPYFPISPTFPWMGLLGFIPLPTKWYIDIGEPVPTAEHGPAAAGNLMVVSQLTDQMRNLVQDQILKRLSQRRSVFFG